MIHLIGTSHVAKESLDLVKKTIKDINPDFVCVELDKKRYNILKGEEKEQSLKDIDAPIFHKIFYWMLKNIQKHISMITGIMPGQEMLDAVRYGKECGSKVALIDRRIEITFERLNNAMLFKERIKLFLYLIISTIAIYLPFLPLSFLIDTKTKKKVNFNLNEIPDEKLVEYSMNYLLNKFPTLYYILVHERNEFMAANLIKISQDSKDIVAVVGAGHIQGIKEILNKHLVDVKVHTRLDLEFPKKTDETESAEDKKDKNKTEQVQTEKATTKQQKPAPNKTRVKKSKKSKESKPTFDPKDFGIDINKL